MRNEDLYHAVFHATATPSEEPWTQSRELLKALLVGGVESGEFDVPSVEVTVDFLLHAYAGPCYHSDDIAHTTGQLQQLFRRSAGAAVAAAGRTGQVINLFKKEVSGSMAYQLGQQLQIEVFSLRGFSKAMDELAKRKP